MESIDRPSRREWIFPDTGNTTASDYQNISIVSVDEDYVRGLNRAHHAHMLFLLEGIRRFESMLLSIEKQGLIHGPVHSSIGEEAVAVGSAAVLRPQDKVTSTHRAHHHFLAKALTYYASPEFDPLTSTLEDGLRYCVRRTLAEVMGLSEGWCNGRGGSMHLCDRTSGNIGTNAIVGGGVPIASGAAFAEKFRETGNVVLCYLGDGATSIGSFHEGINMAVVHKLPIVFLIENNLYAVATNNVETSGLNDLVIRACGFNIPGLIVDGMDPVAVMRSIEGARDWAAGGRGPVLIEAKTYRYCHQSGSLPGSAYGYRTTQEESAWRSRDPLSVYPAQLREGGILSDDEMERVVRLAVDMVEDALDWCITTRSDGSRVVNCRLIPDPTSAAVGVRSDCAEFHDASFPDPADFDHIRPMKMVQAMSAVVARRMETDPEVFVIGEEVGHLRGGAYGVTKDALAAFPDRLYSAPICEAGFTGLAHGAAMAGMKPVVEIMFPDFVLVAADQFFNQIGTARHMYGGNVDVPLVARTRCSVGRGFGAQHSADAVGLFALFPGWRIVAPATPFDYVGLFNSAIRSLDPVLIVEHHELDQTQGPVPSDDLDYLVPLGKAAVRREGSDVTVLAYLSMVPRALGIAEELAGQGISAEVIDLRELDHANIDFDTIRLSIKKTGAMVIVEQAMASQGIGPYITQQVQRRFFDYLDHPIIHAASRNVPMPVSRYLEPFCIVDNALIADCISAAARRESVKFQDCMSFRSAGEIL